MAKTDIVEHLEDLRRRGVDHYFTTAQIHRALQRKGKDLSYTSVWTSLRALCREEEVDWKVGGDMFCRKFLIRGVNKSPIAICVSRNVKQYNESPQTNDERQLVAKEN